jgi:flagellar biogenesis protein FliO
MTPAAPVIAWPAVAAVVLLTALALAAHWWLRSRGLVVGAANPIKVVATRAMGTKRALAIVEVENERFLLGLTDDSISCLSRLESMRRAEATPQPLSLGRVG